MTKTPTNPNPKRHKPGPQERARIRAQEESKRQESQKADEAAMDELRRRFAQDAQRQIDQAADRGFQQRVKDAAAAYLLDLAQRVIKDVTEERTAYLLAGCDRDQIPSSAAVKAAAAQLLQDMARDVAGHPVPAALRPAGA